MESQILTLHSEWSECNSKIQERLKTKKMEHILKRKENQSNLTLQ